MEEINAAGKKQFDEWFKTEEGAKELDDAQYYGSTIRQSFDGVEYIYNPVNGTASLYEELFMRLQDRCSSVQQTASTRLKPARRRNAWFFVCVLFRQLTVQR